MDLSVNKAVKEFLRTQQWYSSEVESLYWQEWEIHSSGSAYEQAEARWSRMARRSALLLAE